jgi:hypothetical protein
VIDSVGVWLAYLVDYCTTGVEVRQMCSGIVADLDHKVVGVHVIEEDTQMVLFVKANGKLEYNYLAKSAKSPQTFKVNKPFDIEYQNNKYRQSSLFSKYQAH